MYTDRCIYIYIYIYIYNNVYDISLYIDVCICNIVYCSIVILIMIVTSSNDTTTTTTNNNNDNNTSRGSHPDQLKRFG